MRPAFALLSTVVLATSALLASPSRAAGDPFVLPEGFVLEPVGPPPGTLNWPVGTVFAPDGRAFLLEKSGRVRTWWFGYTQPTPFIDLQDEVNHKGDRGLLGFALHPGFAPDGGATSWVYLLYTVSPLPGQDVEFDHDDRYSFSRLTRYSATTVNGNVVADLASRQVLLGNQLPDGSVPDAIASVHNSHSNGRVVFGQDGSLLLATGDGAHFDFADSGGMDDAAFDDFTHPVTGLRGPLPKEQDSGSFRSQDLRSLAGKVLRIDPATGNGYPSNPFFDGDPSSNASRVWALGLRQPYRFGLLPGSGSADPAAADPGMLVIGEVGYTEHEELVVCLGGENFGWPCLEGPDLNPPLSAHVFSPNPLSLPDCQGAVAGTPTLPAFSYSHNDPNDFFPPGIHVDDQGLPVPGGVFGVCVIGGDFALGGSYPPEYQGRYFFSDFGLRWIKTLEVDATGQAVAVRDFGSVQGSVTNIVRHPHTGELYFTMLGFPGGSMAHLRHGANEPPVAVAVADEPTGDAPHTVRFDGAGSSDPNGDPMLQVWDFGDGSPTVFGSQPVHEYATSGLYRARMAVYDVDGLVSIDEVDIEVGPLVPAVEFIWPPTSYPYTAPFDEVVSAQAIAVDPSATWAWELHRWTDDDPPVLVDTSSNPGTFPVSLLAPADPTALVYHSVTVTVDGGVGQQVSARLFLYPDHRLQDFTGQLTPIAEVDGLAPPGSQGTGNPDMEVVRDAVFPSSLETDPLRAWDTHHPGDATPADWIGYELVSPPAPEQRFVAFVFQEGPIGPTGGWFEDIGVEVRQGGVWVPAEGVNTYPPYPSELASEPGFDASSFDLYYVNFEPIAGDAVRLVGVGGGSAGFASVSELRAVLLTKDTATPAGLQDVSREGEVIARLFELVPPVSNGPGNPDPFTIQNGTTPAVGSSSDWAQWTSAHGGDQGGVDWVGYRFPATRLLTRLLYQEGLNAPSGGWFDTLGVEVRSLPTDPWTPVSNLTVSPAVPGATDPASGYEQFQLDFDPVPAREVRIVGAPGGTEGYVSVGELRAYQAVSSDDCGWRAVPSGSEPGDTLVLSSWTPPAQGTTTQLELLGVGEGGLAFFLFAPFPGLYPQASLNGTLLVDPATAVSIGPFFLDANGEIVLPLPLPAAPPSWAGAELWWQALAFPASGSPELLWSNGLRMRICP
jgi:glucose/arabinose dehydrogenase/PKD repeat protein